MTDDTSNRMPMTDAEREGEAMDDESRKVVVDKATLKRLAGEDEREARKLMADPVIQEMLAAGPVRMEPDRVVPDGALGADAAPLPHPERDRVLRRVDSARVVLRHRSGGGICEEDGLALLSEHDRLVEGIRDLWETWMDDKASWVEVAGKLDDRHSSLAPPAKAR